MYKQFKIALINSDYCDYLRKFDDRVTYNFGAKKVRPYIGILIRVNNMEYFAPLSSPKEKHRTMKNRIDFIKIQDGDYGAINFNNMIPVTKDNYKLIDFNSRIYSKKWTELLTNQLRWLNDHKKDILFKAELLYKLYKYNNLSQNALKRCCNFILLEQKCEEYNKELIH